MFVSCYFCFIFMCLCFFFFFSSRRRHTRCLSDWSSDVCSSDLAVLSTEMRSAAQPPRLRADFEDAAARYASWAHHYLSSRRAAALDPGDVARTEIGRASCRETAEH